MKIKRTFATDTRQAIRKVREEQGPDAVILGNRKVEGGVEIISAVDYDESLFESPAAAPPAPAAAELEPAAVGSDEQAAFAEALDQWLDQSESQMESSLRSRIDAMRGQDEQPAERGSKPIPAVADKRPAANVEWSQDPTLIAMREEMRNMRELLENQLTVLEWSRASKRHPLRVSLLNRLSDLGLDSHLAAALADSVAQHDEPERAWRHALGLLTRKLPIAEDDVLDQGGVLAFVGPTGVGKTTTLAKLAARFVIRNGARNLALVTTDHFRIGAQEQLQSYARILGVPLHCTQSHDELGRVLAKLADKKLVLIDTAGMSQRDLRLSEQFDALSASSPSIRCYLTLSANTQLAVLDETIRAFKRVRLAGCVVTKIDEAASLGGILTAAIRHELPLAYLGTGQRVPEDLQPARAQHLVSLAVPLGRRYAETVEADSQALRFSGVSHAHV